ncbi:hypothetical protein [Desulfovibrio sp. UIB00]
MMATEFHEWAFLECLIKELYCSSWQGAQFLEPMYVFELPALPAWTKNS